MANFGPRDNSVLYGQSTHRSEDVPIGLIQCGHIEIDQYFIIALVERWRPETHTFHFPIGEATVTLQDVAIIWGLPIEDNFITGVDTKWTTQQWQNYCHQFLGFQPDEKALKNSRIKLTVLHEWLALLRSNTELMPTIIDEENILRIHHMLHGAVPYKAGSYNARNEAGPSNAQNEAGPSNAYTPTNMAYTIDSDNSYLSFIGDESTCTVTPDHRIYHGISPVPFEDLDVPS
ncbi:Serine/threonine-protein phosphatase 7 long form [Sesamum angolense]|uniref:Serine/threonine-protein phosphatase 7 long form n=1 Tax=Sesamum angolense TaxID=2727404 RepID=A0AAE1WAC1_9LAMI|nr:Serine/threonine-protein phosphatase 7 long form [Sesamum angolense]